MARFCFSYLFMYETRVFHIPGGWWNVVVCSSGKWFLGSVGTGFTPHVIIISPGEVSYNNQRNSYSSILWESCFCPTFYYFPYKDFSSYVSDDSLYLMPQISFKLFSQLLINFLLWWVECNRWHCW